jgi:hypothetical protein
MSGFENYPPSTTLRLGDELESLQADADDDEADVSETHIEGLQWAVSEFGEDGTVRVEGFTTASRDRTVDTANRETMGPVGPSVLRTWLVAASITEAPWLDGDEDLADKHDYVGALPPAFSDWLDSQVEEANDLSEGN